jgi:tetratricopeptide (TPR) repeat protein
LFSLLIGGTARGQALVETRTLFNTGKYAEAIAACARAIEDGSWSEEWWTIKIRAELVTGKNADALKTLLSGVERHDESLQMRLLAWDVLRANDRPDDAEKVLTTIETIVEWRPRRFQDARSLVAQGRAALRRGVDARKVLETYYDPAKKESPQSAEPYVATGELALEKNDFALAAESYGAALKRQPDDADLYYGLARSLENNAERATAALEKALELNPNHVDALLLQVDNLIDREASDRAEEIVRKVLDINPRNARAWAYRAVMAHVANEPKTEEACRKEALGTWSTNPEVDHLIGMKLSQKYRFAEGSAMQRQALAFDPKFRPAKVQLCQDLLRLGKEDEGWRLADEVLKEDPYNVLAFNLVTLHDTLSKFSVLETEHFVVRMEPKEAGIYGQRVQALLERARGKLISKYGVELPVKTTIEIFPQQKDFAIRTFGLPGGAGFLGVCFGPVVTVNSPASRKGNPVSWEAVVWHEFCHTVTLGKTKNKMPRWLSEGISVYEERLESPGWGQVMTPQYRELILGGDGGVTPVSKLSGAFLKPPTPMHLMFAYYESSMVVEYIVDKYGIEALKKVLADLGEGVSINEALSKNTVPIEKLDAEFEAWFKKLAEDFGGKVDWERPELPLDAGSAAMAAWNKDHPESFWGLLGEGRALIAERKWAEAKRPLEKAIELLPAYGEAGSAYLLMAAAHRELKEFPAERAMLEKHVALDAESVEARLRLAELSVEAKDWPAVRKWAEQLLGINPLIPEPHRYLAQAAEELGDRSLGIAARRTLLMLDPLDRAEQHFRLSRLLFEEKRLPEARREVVLALEEAPRYRDAHQLLVKIVDADESPTTRPAATRPVAKEAAR